MAHRREHLCSASQLWLPHPALCVVPPECFQGLCIWSGAMGSKSGKLRNIADCDSKLAQTVWFSQTTANSPMSMDFIEQLLTSEECTVILVIVNCLTKQSLFIPTHDSIDSLELAQLFLTHVFLKHGTLSHVTSDWGSEFVSHFF